MFLRPLSVFSDCSWQWLSTSPDWWQITHGFRPRSGGGRVSWMLMRVLPGNFWAFHLKIATILSGSGDSSYLRWPAKDRNIWGRCWHGVTDGFSDLCLFIWYKSSYDDLRWEDTEVMTGAHPQHTCVTKLSSLNISWHGWKIIHTTMLQKIFLIELWFLIVGCTNLFLKSYETCFALLALSIITKVTLN